MASENNLALKRTFMAHERTLMAWIRTSTSLITFGFTIYKFFAYLVEADDTPLADSIVGPREFALAMISIGLVTLAVAAVQYKNSLQLLEQEFGEKYRSLAGALAMVVSFLGLGVLIVVLLRQ
jgi:putative membrane protein